MTVTEWAEKEVSIAIEREKEEAEGIDDWKYGEACYESALRALKCLLKDGHSGWSIHATRNILNRLIDGNPLTPIEDTDDIWEERTHPKQNIKSYQCLRKSSLFKDIDENGLVTYFDTDRVRGISVDAPYSIFYNGFLARLLHEKFPITMPYIPENKPFYVTVEEFLVNPKNGDFDTVGYLEIKTPTGENIEWNRFFKDSENEEEQWTEITKEEYDERKKKGIFHYDR